MAKADPDIRLELERVLRGFTIEGLKEYAMTELEEGTWRRAERLLERAEAPGTLPAYCEAIVAVQKHAPDPEIISVLRLQAISLSSTRTWKVYQLQHKTSEDYVSFPDIAVAVGSILKMPVRAIRGPLGAIVIGIGPGRRLSVAAYYPENAILMVAFKSVPYLEGIVCALGYENVKDCHLSGRHIPSLFRMLQARSGSRNILTVLHNDKENEGPIMPRRTPYGLDFSESNHLGEVIESRLGIDPPKLQSLTIMSEVPVEGRSYPIRTTVTLTSANVMASLTDMAANGMVTEDNLFLKMIDSGRSELRVKYDE